MADTKISELAALTGANAVGADYIPIVDESLVAGSPATANKRMTLTEFLAFVALQGGNLIVGTAAPTTEGVNGDYYYRISTGDNYGPKTGGSWGSIISNLRGESWFSTKQTVAISSGEVAVNYNNGRLIDVAVGANITDFSFTNWPADGTPGSVTFRFALSGTRTIDFSALGTAIRAEGGVVPAVPDSGATLIVTIYSADALATVDIFVGASSMETVA